MEKDSIFSIAPRNFNAAARNFRKKNLPDREKTAISMVGSPSALGKHITHDKKGSSESF